jgi:hypothetical protein
MNYVSKKMYVALLFRLGNIKPLSLSQAEIKFILTTEGFMLWIFYDLGMILNENEQKVVYKNLVKYSISAIYPKNSIT